MPHPFDLKRLYHILVIDNEQTTMDIIQNNLQPGYSLTSANTLFDARFELSQRKYDIILLATSVDTTHWVDLCREIIGSGAKQRHARIILMTNFLNVDEEVTGLNIGAADCIHKPLVGAILVARIHLQAQLIRQQELLGNLARIDALTEIPNRRAFDIQLKNEWYRAKRDRSPLTLAIIDIDHFKLYNDHYGHPEGDKCLYQIARFLSKYFKRRSDFVFRYGGEEFAILLTNTDLTSALTLFHQAQAAIDHVAIPHDQSPVKPTVSFSAGLCCAYPEKDCPTDFISQADIQLYQAKAEGRAQSMGALMSGDMQPLA